MKHKLIKTLIIITLILPLSAHAIANIGISTQVQSLANTLEQIKKALAQRGYTTPTSTPNNNLTYDLPLLKHKRVSESLDNHTIFANIWSMNADILLNNCI